MSGELGAVSLSPALAAFPVLWSSNPLVISWRTLFLRYETELLAGVRPGVCSVQRVFLGGPGVHMGCANFIRTFYPLSTFTYHVACARVPFPRPFPLALCGQAPACRARPCPLAPRSLFHTLGHFILQQRFLARWALAFSPKAFPWGFVGSITCRWQEPARLHYHDSAACSSSPLFALCMCPGCLLGLKPTPLRGAGRRWMCRPVYSLFGLVFAANSIAPHPLST